VAGTGTHIIQRRVDWVEGTRERTRNLSEMFHISDASAADFGITPAIVNGHEIGAPPYPKVNAPTFQFTANALGGVDLRVAATPVNSVSYRMSLPSKGPWRGSFPCGLVLSHIGIGVEHRSAEVNAFAEEKGAAAVPVEVQGFPNNEAIQNWVERHEGVHVQHLQDVMQDVLGVWDRMIENYRVVGQAVQGASPAAAEQNFYLQVGGTPQEIADRLVDEFNQKSSIFHHSAVGRDPPALSVHLEKPLLRKEKLVVLLDARGGPP
jgi:hypothetical protein